eukprot:scaffold649711_cov50-Prasinocladus_malaysianus.AAC.1
MSEIDAAKRFRACNYTMPLRKLRDDSAERQHLPVQHAPLALRLAEWVGAGRAKGLHRAASDK